MFCYVLFGAILYVIVMILMIYSSSDGVWMLWMFLAMSQGTGWCQISLIFNGWCRTQQIDSLRWSPWHWYIRGSGIKQPMRKNDICFSLKCTIYMADCPIFWRSFQPHFFLAFCWLTQRCDLQWGQWLCGDLLYQSTSFLFPQPVGRWMEIWEIQYTLYI